MRSSPASPAVSRVALEDLAETIQGRLEAQGAGRRGGGLRLEVFGGAIGVGVHEWFAAGTEAEGPGSARGRWRAPLGVVMEVGCAALAGAEGRGSLCVWVGRRVWGYGGALARGRGGMLGRSLFVDAPGRAERLWALELSLRSAGVAVVVGDGSGLDLTESRRLQLAAEAGGTVALLARPAGELGALSAARTRWLVSPAPSEGADQRWTVELLRCKGLRPVEERTRRWAAVRSHATGDVRVAPDVSDRSAAAAARAIGRAI